MGLITDEKRQAIIADRMANLPTKKIVEKHAVNRTTVFRIVRHLGLPRRKTGPKGKFSPEEKDAIVADYTTMSVCMLMEKYGVAWETIRRVLDERGIKIRKEAGEVIRKDTKIRPEEHPEIVRKHVKDGLDQNALGLEYGVSQSMISRILRRAGATRSNSESKRKYTHDETAFDTVTDESAYWIGILMTDGSAIESSGHSPAVSLTLEEQDTTHVEKFKVFLKAEHPVLPVRSSGNTKDLPNMYARLSVRSKKLADALAKHGVVPGKLYRTAATPELAVNRHFWRGAIDGDGCLYDGGSASKVKLALCGTQELLEQFRVYAESISPRSRATARKIKGSRAYQIHLTGIHAVRLTHTLYKNTSVFLDRKMAIAMSVIGNPKYDLEEMEKASILYGPKS